MKLTKFNSWFCLLLALCATSCSRQPSEVWDDTKTCGRHVTRGFKTLGGKGGDSRQICSREEFLGWEEQPMYDSGLQEFEAFPGTQLARETVPPPSQCPGDPGCSIPGIQAFRDPSSQPVLAAVFRNVQFDYNSNLVKGRANGESIHTIANYMKGHLGLYVFAEGHCDERGAEAYNLALGIRRSNAVRTALIQEGVDPNRIFTISYGAERPLLRESNENAWAQNRRVQFKVYQR